LAGFCKSRPLSDRPSNFPENSHLFHRNTSFSEICWRGRATQANISLTIEARELDWGRLFCGVEDVDFLPAEIFLTILPVWFSSRVKKDIRGYRRRKENGPARWRAVSIT